MSSGFLSFGIKSTFFTVAFQALLGLGLHPGLLLTQSALVILSFFPRPCRANFPSAFASYPPTSLPPTPRTAGLRTLFSQIFRASHSAAPWSHFLGDTFPVTRLALALLMASAANLSFLSFACHGVSSPRRGKLQGRLCLGHLCPPHCRNGTWHVAGTQTRAERPLTRPFSPPPARAQR